MFYVIVHNFLVINLSPTQWNVSKNNSTWKDNSYNWMLHRFGGWEARTKLFLSIRGSGLGYLMPPDQILSLLHPIPLRHFLMRFYCCSYSRKVLLPLLTLSTLDWCLRSNGKIYHCKHWNYHHKSSTFSFSDLWSFLCLQMNSWAWICCFLPTFPIVEKIFLKLSLHCSLWLISLFGTDLPAASFFSLLVLWWHFRLD